MTITIQSLHIYPVKSMAGIMLDNATLDDMGLQWDRRWMLIDAQGEFMTARRFPTLVRIQPLLEKDGTLALRFPDGERLSVPRVEEALDEVTATVWQDRVMAKHLCETLDEKLSDYLGESTRLVFIEQETVRQVDLNYAAPGDRTGFSDGFPLLLISEASLEDLNSRMDHPLPMSRFRPNIVVTGCPPYAEDQWQTVELDGLTLQVVKPCSRCIMTTVDPATGKRDGKEPLATLKTYRQIGNKVMFGQNVIHQQKGTLTVGHPLTVTSHA